MIRSNPAALKLLKVSAWFAVQEFPDTTYLKTSVIPNLVKVLLLRYAPVVSGIQGICCCHVLFLWLATHVHM